MRQPNIRDIIGIYLFVVLIVVGFPGCPQQDQSEIAPPPPPPPHVGWEAIGHPPGIKALYRAPVPDGWLIFCHIDANNGEMVLIFDSEHKWLKKSE